MSPSTWTVDFFIWSIIKGLQIKLPLAFIAFGANFVVRSSICDIFFSYIDYFATSMTIFQVWIVQMFTRMKFLISQNSHSWSVPEKSGRNISNLAKNIFKSISQKLGLLEVPKHILSNFGQITQCFAYLISMMRSFLGQRKSYIKNIWASRAILQGDY